MFTAASHRQSSGHRVYFFLDEFQQIISDGIKLIFEQFRDLGGTIIAAHQTAGQLSRQGTDLGETVDSCTAVKQVYRASDLHSLDRLEKLAGSHRETTPMWMQLYERGSGDLVERYEPIHAVQGVVKVREEERPRLDRRRMLEISSSRMASLIRFTFGSGYTQFAGATVPIVSQYPITMDEREDRTAARRSMTTTTNHVCSCGRGLELVDASAYSRTTACSACRRCTLIVNHPNFELYIGLADFHLKRGGKLDQRPLDDFGMATRLVECLTHDEWPSPAAIADFGIDSPAHFGAMQRAVREGITAYELDRVMGDGPAITQLVRGVPNQPFRDVRFRTAYDGLVGLWDANEMSRR